uniref:Uncharacterized protein n=1 Tax=Rhizophora mucronata TaxID=61149 RepID=A0A2P2P9G2_RHIMU
MLCSSPLLSPPLPLSKS